MIEQHHNPCPVYNIVQKLIESLKPLDNLECIIFLIGPIHQKRLYETRSDCDVYGFIMREPS